MEIELYGDMPSSRPSQICLSLQLGCVFADFDVDDAGLLYLVRISFDGYGCCTAPADIGRLSAPDSQALLAMRERGVVDSAVVEPMLRAYFHEHRDVLWADALEQNGLV